MTAPAGSTPVVTGTSPRFPLLNKENLTRHRRRPPAKIRYVFEPVPPPPGVVDVLEQPDSVAAELATSRPAPDLIPALSLLDPAALSQAGRVDLLVALERHAAWLAACQQQVLASMAADPAAVADPVDRTGRHWVREDVSCALRLSGITAQRRLDVAQVLADDLPATLGLLRRGEISYRHALGFPP
jgi:hypothetical protein